MAAMPPICLRAMLISGGGASAGSAKIVGVYTIDLGTQPRNSGIFEHLSLQFHVRLWANLSANLLLSTVIYLLQDLARFYNRPQNALARMLDLPLAQPFIQCWA